MFSCVSKTFASHDATRRLHLGKFGNVESLSSRAIGRSHNRVEVAEVTAFRLASKIPKGSQGHALSRHSSQPHGIRPTCSNVFNIFKILFNILFNIEFNEIELIESVRCQTETIQYVGSWNVLHTSTSSQAFRIIHLVIAENYAGLLKITACTQA